MKTKITLLMLATIGAMQVRAQDSSYIRNWYAINASEIIFSGGEVKSYTDKTHTQTVTLDNVVRFTVFLHIQEQFHYNFSNTFGMFTGLSLRNVGFINKFHINDSLGNVTIKQRSYSLGLPLALKIGNMSEGFWLAAGAEAELMFAYKEKFLYDDQKTKNYETISQWFSDENVTLFNPSLFADIRFSQGSYIRFKYYLYDFLKNKDFSFLVPNTTTTVYYYPESSKLFYFALGTSIRERKHKKHSAKKTEV